MNTDCLSVIISCHGGCPQTCNGFRKKTAGKPVLMGSKTLYSIGKPSPDSQNILIEGCIVVHSLHEARASAADLEEIMAIGGAETYTRLLVEADRLYITQIHDAFEVGYMVPGIQPVRVTGDSLCLQLQNSAALRSAHVHRY